jgi:hypothetical protein
MVVGSWSYITKNDGGGKNVIAVESLNTRINGSLLHVIMLRGIDQRHIYI